MSKEGAMNARIVNAMRQSGAYQEIMDAGSELERVKRFVQQMDKPFDTSGQRQRPGMPCFPDLPSKPFSDAAGFPAAGRLEAGFERIAAEARRLTDKDFLTYYPRGRPASGTVVATQPGLWKLFLFRYMGARVEPSIAKCPETYNIIHQLPDFCGDYPWGDALFSVHLPGTHLPPHCSIDNLRVRIHLGIDIPAGSEIRVDNEVRRWESGRCLVFDDSFEHETWNNSSKRRTILIVDVWHPDLTSEERRALLCLFNDLGVKRVFFMKRIKNTDADPALIRKLASQSQELNERFR